VYLTIGFLGAFGALLILSGLFVTTGDSSRWMFLLPGGFLLALAALLSVNVYFWRRGTRNVK
jgi:hypothetical protein